jgi:DNA-binding transcriptional ArsR family regulator
MSSTIKRRTAAEGRLEAVRHPLRSAILQVLTNRAASPSEMAKELAADLPSVSHHTKRLVELGCAELAYERKTGSSVEHVYRATERHLVELGDWNAVIESGPEFAEFLVGEYMQAIVNDFALAADAEVGQDEDFHISRTPVSVDAQGLDEAMEIFERAFAEMADVHRRALERGNATIRMSSSLALFRLTPPR